MWVLRLLGKVCLAAVDGFYDLILLIGINLQDLRKDGRSRDKVDKVMIPY